MPDQPPTSRHLAKPPACSDELPWATLALPPPTPDPFPAGPRLMRQVTWPFTAQGASHTHTHTVSRRVSGSEWSPRRCSRHLLRRRSWMLASRCKPRRPSPSLQLLRGEVEEADRSARRWLSVSADGHAARKVPAAAASTPSSDPCQVPCRAWRARGCPGRSGADSGAAYAGDGCTRVSFEMSSGMERPHDH